MSAKRAAPTRFPGAFVRVKCCECPALIHVRRNADTDNARCERCRAVRKHVLAELRQLRVERAAEGDVALAVVPVEDDGPPARLGIPAALAIIHQWMR